MSSSQSRTPKTSTGSMISSSSFSTGNNAYRPIRPASTSTIPIPTHPQQQHQQEQQQPPALILKSAMNGAKGFAANLRRESMTKLDIVDGADEDKSMMSSKKVSLLVPPSTARERQPSLDSGCRPLTTSSVSKNAYKLPASLADSQVAREKPTMRTRLVVCLLSGCMILFCLIKLFYWK